MAHVLERDAAVFPRARAVSTDEEVMRIWQQTGLVGTLKKDMLWDKPIDFVDANGKSFLTFAPTPEYDDAALHKSNAWYDSWIYPFNGTSTGSTSQIETNLQACASSPDLYTKVSTNGDITSALQALFLKVASDPRLTQ